ncbi:hypothetical protein P700755_002835 [Psychroflexus torquis ATCC 700755]|uniref:Uncharacterized protein n=2 Tax=Psychroflexus TaxID=83612 RepID=K4IKD2_PSYTT|nr:hypothetical protein P700755_002835 [Psychroflexus torquis ATCC 700755]
MTMKILEVKTNLETKSIISLVTKNKAKLPSINDGWRFNFSKHSTGKDYETYILKTDKTPEIIEGCLIINTKTPFQVYMAFVEVAPHNKGNEKKYDRVAGCLIAFACRQSFINDKEGYLAFDVLEDKKENELRLMKLYSQKYNGVRLDNSTTMIILPKGSEKLINEFLK